MTAEDKLRVLKADLQMLTSANDASLADLLTLAENLIRLSGLEPYKDIQIKEIGLRPGEKLYEELLMNSENLSSTENRRIFIEQQRELSAEKIAAALRQLSAALAGGKSGEEITALMKRLVPTYRDPDEVNQKAETVLHDGATNEADGYASEVVRLA